MDPTPRAHQLSKETIYGCSFTSNLGRAKCQILPSPHPPAAPLCQPPYLDQPVAMSENSFLLLVQVFGLIPQTLLY